MDHGRLRELEWQRDDLYERLEGGYAQIERGMAEGDDITAYAYEGFWIALLREYEAACAELQRAL